MSRILEVPLLIQMIKGSVPLGQVVQITHDLSSQRPKNPRLDSEWGTNYQSSPVESRIGVSKDHVGISNFLNHLMDTESGFATPLGVPQTPSDFVSTPL